MSITNCVFYGKNGEDKKENKRKRKRKGKNIWNGAIYFLFVLQIQIKNRLLRVFDFVNKIEITQQYSISTTHRPVWKTHKNN